MPFIKIDVHVHIHGAENKPGDIAEQIKKLETKMGQEFDGLKADVEALNGKLDTAAASVGEVKKDTDYLKAKLDDLAEGATAEQIADLRTTVTGLSAKADALATSLSALDAETDSSEGTTPGEGEQPPVTEQP